MEGGGKMKSDADFGLLRFNVCVDAQVIGHVSDGSLIPPKEDN